MSFQNLINTSVLQNPLIPQISQKSTHNVLHWHATRKRQTEVSTVSAANSGRGKLIFTASDLWQQFEKLPGDVTHSNPQPKAWTCVCITQDFFLRSWALAVGCRCLAAEIKQTQWYWVSVSHPHTDPQLIWLLLVGWGLTALSTQFWLLLLVTYELLWYKLITLSSSQHKISDIRSQLAE